MNTHTISESPVHEAATRSSDKGMQAIRYHRYGSPEELKLEQIPLPGVGDKEIRIRIHAASVNALDWRALRASPFFIRFMGQGVLKPKNKILGADVAGVVEAVGKHVSRFREGDAVFGDISHGGFAEYACAHENLLALKPEGVTFEEAAALPVAALTALQGLRDTGRIQQGQRVLINGASGGVGTFAVQLAKLFGAEVTGVCSTKKLDMVRSIGADHVIDYTKEDFAERGEVYDLILDLALYRSISISKRALSPGGVYVVAGGSGGRLVQSMLVKSWDSGTEIAVVMAKSSPEDLAYLGELLANWQISPVIDKRFRLNKVPEAIRYVEEGHVRGKAIVTLVL